MELISKPIVHLILFVRLTRQEQRRCLMQLSRSDIVAASMNEPGPDLWAQVAMA